MTLKKIVARPDGSAELWISGEDALHIPYDDVRGLSLKAPLEISGELYEILKERDAYFAAKQSAYRSLDRSDFSKALLVRRLRQKGADAEAAAVVADELEEKGYISDPEYARRIVRHYSAGKCYGRRRVMQELFARGIDKEEAESALDEEGQPDEDLIFRYFEKKYRKIDLSDEKKRKKCADALARAGFLWEDIRRLFDAHFAQDEDW